MLFGRSSRLVIARIHAGLGNQMFQYAAGLALARHRKAECILDISSYESDRTRSYMLDCFAVPEPKVGAQKAEQLKSLARANGTLYEEGFLRFNKDLFETRLPLYLDGYFQSEKYFMSIEAEVRSRFGPRESISPVGAERVYQINRSAMPISVHVRRSDYKSSDVMVLLDAAFYRRALDLFRSIYGNEIDVFVFSDEIEDARAIMPDLGLKYTFLRPNVEKPWEDIWAMAACRSHIVANSSFSWWGAWLNCAADKRVIAPRTWLHLKRAPERWSLLDLVPEGWILI